MMDVLVVFDKGSLRVRTTLTGVPNSAHRTRIRAVIVVMISRLVRVKMKLTFFRVKSMILTVKPKSITPKLLNV